MSSSFFKKYFSGAVLLNAPSLASVVVNLVTIPVILSNISAADYGIWQFTVALQAWIVALTAGNITVASKRGIARSQDGTFLFAFISRYKLLVPGGAVLLIAAAAVNIAGWPIHAALMAVNGVYLIAGYLFNISFYEFLVAKERFGAWSFWQILIYTVSAVSSTAVAYSTKNVTAYAVVYLGSTSILTLAVWVNLVRKEKLFESYRRGEIDHGCKSFGLKLIPIDLISVTATKASHFLIGPFFGFADLAVFSIANNLRDRFAGIVKTLRPLLYADFSKTDRKDIGTLINRYLIKIAAVGILASFVFVVASWFYIGTFLPERFESAKLYALILSLSLPVVVLMVILNTILESHLRYKELAFIGVVPNVIKILLILICGYLWRVTGICVAVSLSNWVLFIFYYVLVLREDAVLRYLDRYPYIKKLASKY